MSDHTQTVSGIEIDSITLKMSSGFPNNPDLPLLIYRKAFSESSDARAIEGRFSQNNWGGSWVDGIYPFDHYHSITHEVLGIAKGGADVQLGGPKGIIKTVSEGDVIIIPAGVSHKKIDSSENFTVVGAYPDSRQWDMNYGKPEEILEAKSNIDSVPLPRRDPVYGKDGPLYDYWKR